MPIKLALSQVRALPFDFEAAVASHIKAKMEHRFAAIGESAPAAPHAWVGHAVKRVIVGEDKPDDFVPDFEIIDDTPPPLTLDQKKQILSHQVMTARAEAAHKIVPLLKSRIWNIEHQRMLTAIHEIPREAIPIVVLKMDGLTHRPETDDEHKARALGLLKVKSSPEDIAFFQAHEERLKQIAAIDHHSAKLEGEIHDLTEETVDAWKMAPFA